MASRRILPACLSASTLLLCAAACGGLSAARATDSLLDDRAFPMSISTVTIPIISWSGGYGRSLRIVDQSRTPWSLSATDGSGGFAPPVAYNVLPSRAYCGFLDELCPRALSLQTEYSYTLLLIRADGQYGAKQFRP